MTLHKTIASVLGIGYIKGGGTIAAIVYCLLWYWLSAGYQNDYRQIVFILLIILLGTWASNKVDAEWGKDSSKVVIDEVAGMAVSLLFVPHNYWYVLISLALFRFFDIVKPLGIRKCEKFAKGYGVMADDILAGVYSLIIIQLLIVGSYLL